MARTRDATLLVAAARLAGTPAWALRHSVEVAAIKLPYTPSMSLLLPAGIIVYA